MHRRFEPIEVHFRSDTQIDNPILKKKIWEMFSFSLKHEMQFTAKKLSLFEIQKLRSKR
jgi:hypothetical protein